MNVQRRGLLPALGAAVTAVLASSCCIAPVVLAALGAGGAGFARRLEPYRPYFLAATFVLLGAAFYAAYRKPCSTEGQEGACCTPAAGRRVRIGLWVVTAFALASAFYPQAAARHARRAAAAATPVARPLHKLTLTIEGMTCEACAAHIEKELAAVPGVVGARVSYARKQAVVEWSKMSPSREALLTAISRAGYKAIAIDGLPVTAVSSPPAGEGKAEDESQL